MSKTLDGTNTFENVDEVTFSAGSTVVHMQAIAGGEEYNFNLPLDAGSPGDVLTSTGGGIAPTQWIPSAAGAGTVTSVQVSAPTFMTSSGGPITTNGTITLGLSGIPLAVTSGGTGTTTSTGTGSNVLSNGPTLTGTTNINTLNLTTTLAVTEGGTGTTTSTGTGSLVLSTAPTITAPAINNPGLGGTVTSSGPIQISDTTVSTSTGTGALTVAGGVGIVGDLNVGGTITGTVVPGSINTSGQIITTNATASTTPTTGAIIATAGGLGIQGAVNVGGTIDSAATITAADKVVANSTTNASSTTTGSLITAGGLGVARNAHFGGTSFNARNVQEPFTFAVNTTITGTTNTCLIHTSGTTHEVILPVGNSTGMFQGLTYFITSFGALNVKDSATTTLSNIGPNQSAIVFLASVGNPGIWRVCNLGSTFLYNELDVTSSLPIITPGLTSSQPIEATSFTSNSVDQFTYSKGTWTPTLAGSVTYTQQTGKYIQSGAEVKVTFRLVFDVLVSGPQLQITNLPFTATNDTASFGVVGVGGLPGGPSVILGKAIDSTSNLDFYRVDESAITLDNTWPTITFEGLVTYFIN